MKIVGFWVICVSIVEGFGQAIWSIPKGVLTALEVTKIAVFKLMYVSLVQVIGQARWYIPKGVQTASEVMKIDIFGHGLSIDF